MAFVERARFTDVEVQGDILATICEMSPSLPFYMRTYAPSLDIKRVTDGESFAADNPRTTSRTVHENSTRTQYLATGSR